jgi:hypothetical protein
LVSKGAVRESAATGPKKDGLSLRIGGIMLLGRKDSDEQETLWIGNAQHATNALGRISFDGAMSRRRQLAMGQGIPPEIMARPMIDKLATAIAQVFFLFAAVHRFPCDAKVSSNGSESHIALFSSRVRCLAMP